jgi:N-acetylmuramoyl-L-alanine amidase
MFYGGKPFFRRAALVILFTGATVIGLRAVEQSPDENRSDVTAPPRAQAYSSKGAAVDTVALPVAKATTTTAKSATKKSHAKLASAVKKPADAVATGKPAAGVAAKPGALGAATAGMATASTPTTTVVPPAAPATTMAGPAPAKTTVSPAAPAMTMATPGTNAVTTPAAPPTLAQNLDAIEPPLVNYPLLVPLSTLGAHSITPLRHLQGPHDLTRIPVPNPWCPIDLYQQTITRQDFETKLKTLYDPFGVFPSYYTIDDRHVAIYPAMGDRRVPQFTLQFAPPGQAPRPTPRWFRTPEEFRAEPHPLDKPLSGLRVAIDPGHIGGVWAQMEERSTRYRGSAPVQEGDLNLITGRILKQELTALGASVYVVRDSTDPVTPYRPADMIPLAEEMLRQQAARSPRLRALPPDKLNLLFGHRLKELSEFLFYRCSEIVERGNKIRNNFVPDITITLYIDATPGSGRGRLTSGNANIFFVHGAYTRSEMADPEMQRRCVYKILEGSAGIEAKVAGAIADVFAQRTKLGSVKYGNSATTRLVLPDNPAVVARNLAANREYDGPVVCTEPYFMNNRVVYQRLLAGDYDGVKTFNGKPYGSIFREYADCVAQGLVRAYANNGIAGTNSGSAMPGPVK